MRGCRSSHWGNFGTALLQFGTRAGGTRGLLRFASAGGFGRQSYLWQRYLHRNTTLRSLWLLIPFPLCQRQPQRLREGQRVAMGRMIRRSRR